MLLEQDRPERFTFRITNTTFAGGGLGCGAICAGQHCGLGGAGQASWALVVAGMVCPPVVHLYIHM